MIRNYIKVAVRNLLRNKLYAFINVIGLTLGIACTTLLTLYIIDELSFDKFHSKSDQIFRVVIGDRSNPAEPRFYGQTPPPLGPEMVDEIPDLENVVRLWKTVGHLTFKHEGQRFAEREWYMVEPNFLDFFDFNVVAGNRETAFDQPNTMALTVSTARRYFGDSDPIGQTLNEEQFGELLVTAIIEDPPSNSHLDFGILVSMSVSGDGWQEYLNSFQSFGAYTYLLKSKNAKHDSRQAIIANFLASRFGEDGAGYEVILQPLSEIHFNSAEIEFGTDANKGDFRYVGIFGVIAIFILLIASINYINLATARSMERGKEIGLRKVAGAHRGQLVLQFFSESTIISGLSCLFAIGLVDVSMPYFNAISGKAFTFSGNELETILLIQLSVTFAVGILSGLYPALYLSGLKPIQTVHKKTIVASGKVPLRKILVVAQFALSIFMITVTMVIYSQLAFIQNFDTGFNKDQVVVVDINSGNTRRDFEIMKTEFGRHPEVKGVAVSNRVPGEWKIFHEAFLFSDNLPGDSLRSYFMTIDEDLIGFYDLSMVAGENFEGNTKGDSTKLILNETAAKMLGIQEDPLGAQIVIPRGQDHGNFTVIGIVKDFNFQSLHEPIRPLAMGYWNNGVRSIDYFSIRISGNDMEGTMRHLTEIHEKFDPASPIEYHFLSDQIDRYYEKEKRAAQIFVLGASLTILIACLGLFGLASFSVSKRMKEIGIRKALGATTKGVYVLISTSFLVQVVIAWMLAIPASYFIMTEWLQMFTYRIDISIWVFVLSGLIAGLIAWVTVSYKSIHASMINPAQTLRYE